MPPVPDFVALPGGVVQLRDARTGSTRSVELQPFELAHVPVAEGGLPTPFPTWSDTIAWCTAASLAAGLRPAYARNDDGTVRWDVTADGYRLPTEAEWEYACRAGTTGPHYGPLDEIAWVAQDHGPAPVGRKTPNAFGLHDMLGNVWEWCWDYVDPARYRDYRVLKGGSWSNGPQHVRVGVRRGAPPDAQVADVGLRIARGAGTVPGAHQGWSREADEERAHLPGPLPIGWTPLGR
jgi:sulfatase modifying factor 1